MEYIAIRRLLETWKNSCRAYSTFYGRTMVVALCEERHAGDALDLICYPSSECEREMCCPLRIPALGPVSAHVPRLAIPLPFDLRAASQ